MKFSKYQALGNDYIVINPGNLNQDLTAKQIRQICHRNYGIGSDGILLGPLPSDNCDFALRIYNPDGSEAEKSGNGLRIFACYLWDEGLVKDAPFTVATLGGKVTCQVHVAGRSITVEMGKVSFNSTQIPVLGPAREVLNESLPLAGEEFSFCAATVGNPHCVILREELSPEETKSYGPIIETNPRFPNRTNVQFMKVLDRGNIAIEIWERGAGYTLASGSSSCAAAAVAHRLGFCDKKITVHMPGGELTIVFSEDFSAVMTGPVAKVAEGEMAEEVFQI
jgi:diaminopimelate epimerase